MIFHFRRFSLPNMDAILDPMLIDEDDDDVDDLILMHILHDDELLGNRAAIFGAFDLRLYNNTRCLSMFRFLLEDIPRLATALILPDPMVVNRVTVSSNFLKFKPILKLFNSELFFHVATTGLCMCLRRLAYPNRLVDLEQIFGYSSTVISAVCRFVFREIERQWGYKLDNLDNNQFLTRDKLRQYAHVSNKAFYLVKIKTELQKQQVYQVFYDSIINKKL